MNITDGHFILSTTKLFGNLGDDADSSGQSIGFTIFVNISCATDAQVCILFRDMFNIQGDNINILSIIKLTLNTLTAMAVQM